jgi:hypothetical protein
MDSLRLLYPLLSGMKEFETKAREIFSYLSPYRERGIVDPSTGRIDPQWAMRMRYADFAEAQKLMVEELKSITAKKRDLSTQIKAARKGRDKLQAARFVQAIEQEKYKETIIRKLADSIAWQLIEGRGDYVQWLYSSEEPPSIDTSNIESVSDEVDKLNELDPLSFSLISDLTSFVQIGDILRRDTSGIIKIIEVKEGEENIKAIRIAENELRGDQDESSLAGLRSIYGRHLADQARRVQRQMNKGNKVSEILNTGAGEDPKTGSRVIVQEPRRMPAAYKGELAEQLLRLDTRPWAYTVIEDCLMVGCYQGLMKKAGGTLLISLARQLFQGNNVPINFRKGLNSPVCEPIFLKPLREDDIFDIIFDRTRVFMVLSLDWIIQAFRKQGAEVKWLSRKETNRLIHRSRYEQPFAFKGRAISVENDEWSLILTGGSLRRIFFDNFLPSSVVSMLLDSLNRQT